MRALKKYLVMAGVMCVIALIFVLIFTPSDIKTEIMMTLAAAIEFLMARIAGNSPRKRRKTA